MSWKSSSQIDTAKHYTVIRVVPPFADSVKITASCLDKHPHKQLQVLNTSPNNRAVQFQLNF